MVSYLTRVCAQCLHHELSDGISNRCIVTVAGINNVSMGGEVTYRYCVQGLRIVRKRGRVSRVLVAGFEDRLVCEDDDADMFVRGTGGEINMVSYKQNLPPWGEEEEGKGNMSIQGKGGEIDGGGNIQDKNGFGKSGDLDDQFLDTKGLSSELGLKLHFLEERDEGVLSKRILGLSRSNKVRSALELFMSMGASGLQPTPHACNSLLSCLLRNGFFNDALKIFWMMKKEMTSGHTYSLMLKAIASTRGCDSALKMFTELERRGALEKVFDAITYNTMISICVKANNWVQAERFWKALKENGHSSTAVTYNLLVSVFVRCGQSELAYDAYSEMINNGLIPGEDMMQAIISVCTKEGKWGLAYGVFQSMLKSGLVPNVIAYNALINSLGKAGEVELTFKIFALMKSSGHTPDAYTWNALLGALNRSNRSMDALRLFESLQRKKGMLLNFHIYNTALFSCQRHGLWERALQLLWQMEASGIPVSVESYNLVVSTCEVARMPKVALQVYEQMVHKKCTPDTFTYLSLIRACVWGSLWSEVKDILDHVPPDASLYNAAIHGMCLRGEISSAKKIYMKMSENGLNPDGKTRALMLQNLRKESTKQNNRHRLRRQRR